LLKDRRVSDARNEARKLYGKVPQEEYLEAIDRFPKAETTELDETMGWYYEFYGADEGVLNIDFSCQCRTCGYSFSYRNSVNMEVKE
jgi:predicted dithiol-disulfide oxidoreductase (DUF899 family)